MSELTDQQLERYARHVILDEVGEEGQARLLASSVLVVGAGGLGSPLLQYLAAAGVGRLGIIDDDRVELSNLQRQTIHTTRNVGRPKVASAAEFIAAINPDVKVEIHEARLTGANAAALVARYDIVADGSDNFPTRYLLNDACYLGKKPLVFAALLRFDAQLSVFKAHLGTPHPCYRCLFPEAPPEDLVPRCEQAGIFGALAGTVGALQATETLKELLGIGESLSGRLLIYDGLATDFRTIRIPRDPACRLCGPQADIRDLAEHSHP
jgi:adenylyltransferase/sulfurtransferase